MTRKLDALQTVQFTVPLPPVSLRANSRAHWSRKKKDADEYSVRVWAAWRSYMPDDGWVRIDNRARVRYEWRYAGVQPDHGNLGGNTKYLQDIICMVPRNYAGREMVKDRWYLGLIGDDRFITAEYEAVKVKTRAEECVVVTVDAVIARDG